MIRDDRRAGEDGPARRFLTLKASDPPKDATFWPEGEFTLAMDLDENLLELDDVIEISFKKLTTPDS